MKQDIKCNKCGDSAKKQRPVRQGRGAYEEFEKWVPGIALRDYLCDLCGVPLPKGSLCYAASVWTERNPYYNWEPDFVTVISQHDADAMRDTIERLGKDQSSVATNGG